MYSQRKGEGLMRGNFNYYKSNISDWDKKIGLIVDQGKSNLTLLFGYMNIFIALITLRCNVVAWTHIHIIKWCLPAWFTIL